MPCNDGNYCPDGMVTERLYLDMEAMLCAAVTMLEEYYEGDLRGLEIAMGEADERLVAWYEGHTRREGDRVRLEAAQKLTARERRLLNIDVNGQPIGKKKKVR